MDDYGPETYGERVADVYDTWYKGGDPTPEVTFLHDLAAGGRVLELGVGTGRVAVPLAATGLDVHGIEASPAMVEQMRAKPGGDAVTTVIGDMADIDVAGTFAVVFVVYNTFFMLLTQEDQVRCFRNVAAHLAPGGRFVVHALVPDLSRIERGETLEVRDASLDFVRLNATTFDRMHQRLDTTQIRITEQGTRLVHAKLRYAFPPELDLMAQLAGLTLEARWATFDQQPFTDESAMALSVYRA
jgi:SAM-dependent methyltransferase